MQVFNAKNYGIPQSRERVFVVSMKENCWFNFPPTQELKLTLRDLLEEKVAEKYYLAQERVDAFIAGLSAEKLKQLENAW